ncbi:MAG: DUF92 domain-containing protein [Candidatus Eiseniibacteriota bacterium]
MNLTPPTTIALILAAGGASLVAITGQGTKLSAAAGFAVAVLAILGLGPGALFPLAVFVLGGGAITRVGHAAKADAGAAEANRGRRGVAHVVAKLGIPAALGVAGLLMGRTPTLCLGYASALAGALADTSGTEIGPLGRGAAFRVEGLRIVRVPHGTPGGISGAGLLAALLGAAVVAGAAIFTGLVSGTWALGVSAAAGFGAALVESVAASTPVGKALGHFGRNVMVSALATAVGLAAGAARWGAV